MKKCKQAYYDRYFGRNWNNIKNTWKGIKSLLFASIGETTKKSIKYSPKHFSNYLSSESDSRVQYFCDLLIKKK